jgi:uncharacterized membrane protein
MPRIEIVFLWFLTYSIFGWIYETILCSIKKKRFINRGFLNGPYCPIYGCGAVLDILLLGKIHNTILLFFAAALLTGGLEYVTSVIMEKLFHARWWDYSDKKFNIGGRVYLTGIIVFGTLSVILILFLHPAVSSIIAGLSARMRSALALSLFLVLLTDAIYTITKLSEFGEILQDLGNRLEEPFQSTKTRCVSVFTTLNEKTKTINSQIRRMILAFPNLKSIRFGVELKKLRELLQSGKNSKYIK